MEPVVSLWFLNSSWFLFPQSPDGSFKWGNVQRRCEQCDILVKQQIISWAAREGKGKKWMNEWSLDVYVDCLSVRERFGVGDQHFKLVCHLFWNPIRLLLQSFLDVVIELQKLDLVSPERVDFMEECLRSISRVDLAKKVAKYKVPGENAFSFFYCQVFTIFEKLWWEKQKNENWKRVSGFSVCINHVTPHGVL